MAIGQIKEVRTEDGQVIAVIETGSGPAITATIMPQGSFDFQPLAGDAVFFNRAGQEIVVTAVFSEDSQAGPGEAVMFSRSAAGTITAVVHLKADGKIEIKPDTGKTAEVGTGADFVALATKVNYMFNLIDTIIKTWVPFATDGGAALQTLWNSSYPAAKIDVDSTNLKAD